MHLINNNKKTNYINKINNIKMVNSILLNKVNQK